MTWWCEVHLGAFVTSDQKNKIREKIIAFQCFWTAVVCLLSLSTRCHINLFFIINKRLLMSDIVLWVMFAARPYTLLNRVVDHLNKARACRKKPEWKMIKTCKWLIWLEYHTPVTSHPVWIVSYSSWQYKTLVVFLHIKLLPSGFLLAFLSLLCFLMTESIIGELFLYCLSFSK